MKLRFACVSREAFEVCKSNNVWGANTTHLRKWNIGDLVVFKIGTKLCALAEVIGEAYITDVPLWENGLYWDRIPLRFIYILDKDNEIDFTESYRAKFLQTYGEKYGYVFVNKAPVNEDIAKEIVLHFGAASKVSG